MGVKADVALQLLPEASRELHRAGVGLTFTMRYGESFASVRKIFAPPSDFSGQDYQQVEVGDQLIGIDGEDVSGCPTSLLRRMLLGREGSRVTLSFRKDPTKRGGADGADGGGRDGDDGGDVFHVQTRRKFFGRSDDARSGSLTGSMPSDGLSLLEKHETLKREMLLLREENQSIFLTLAMTREEVKDHKTEAEWLRAELARAVKAMEEAEARKVDSQVIEEEARRQRGQVDMSLVELQRERDDLKAEVLRLSASLQTEKSLREQSKNAIDDYRTRLLESESVCQELEDQVGEEATCAVVLR
eukprot:761269-Hanusia_phi.AAC.1